MSLRIASAVLWFLAGSGLAGGIALQLGLNQSIGLVVGAAWAAFILADPKDLIWRVGKRSSRGMAGLVKVDRAPESPVGTGI
jgi:hypothetical protein